MPDGFLVIDKPAGITSHDVVARVRRVFGIKRVGHTGTLDPFATGVLPVALGLGTKAIPFLDESVKEYRAVMQLGTATDTQDSTGSVVYSGEWQQLTPDRVALVMAGFIGTISQLPPMYSAVKQCGVPLYRLARKGETVERQARQVMIHSLVIDRLELPAVEFTVRCSRGTYVRTLADDIGRLLGCGAHLTGLRRTISGPFGLAAAIPFDSLVAGAADRLAANIIATAAALGQLRRLPLAASGCDRVRHGIAPTATDLLASPDSPLPGERLLLLCGERLVAVAESKVGSGAPEGPFCRLLRVFSQDCPLHPGK